MAFVLPCTLGGKEGYAANELNQNDFQGVSSK